MTDIETRDHTKEAFDVALGAVTEFYNSVVADKDREIAHLQDRVSQLEASLKRVRARANVTSNEQFTGPKAMGLWWCNNCGAVVHDPAKHEPVCPLPSPEGRGYGQLPKAGGQ